MLDSLAHFHLNFIHFHLKIEREQKWVYLKYFIRNISRAFFMLSTYFGLRKEQRRPARILFRNFNLTITFSFIAKLIINSNWVTCNKPRENFHSWTFECINFLEYFPSLIQYVFFVIIWRKKILNSSHKATSLQYVHL